MAEPRLMKNGGRVRLGTSSDPTSNFGGELSQNFENPPPYASKDPSIKNSFNLSNMSQRGVEEVPGSIPQFDPENGPQRLSQPLSNSTGYDCDFEFETPCSFECSFKPPCKYRFGPFMRACISVYSVLILIALAILVWVWMTRGRAASP